MPNGVLFILVYNSMTELEAKKLYVKNLDWNLTEEQVQAYFAQFGEIASIKLPLDKFKRRRGFAFIEFANEADAAKAIAEANGKSIDGTEREMSVEMARQEDPAEREARYAARDAANASRPRRSFDDAPRHYDND
ncbi:MAG: RNA-binding protein [bacterium]